MSDLPALPIYRVDVTFHSGATFTYHAYSVTFTKRGLSIRHTNGVERVQPTGFRSFQVQEATP